MCTAATAEATPTDSDATDRPLRVAVVDEEVPYPPTSGKRIRTLNLIRRLAPRHRITYLCHRNADESEARQAAAYLRGLGVTPVLVDRRVPPKSGLAFYARLAGNLLSTLPYSVQSHTSGALRRALRDHAAAHPVDLWHCEWTPYARSLEGTVAGPTLVMAHNVESQIWRRYQQTESQRLRRWYIAHQRRKFERFEGRVLRSATRVVTVSRQDAERIHEEFGAEPGRIDVVDNGVDLDYFRPGTEARDPARLLFVGGLDWRPNLDAVRLLLDHILPAVGARVPEVRLDLVGRNPPDWLRRRTAGRSDVLLHADVPDVRPFLWRCGVLAVPLRIGGGSRLKILEALATETPVVSTRVGAEGLSLEDGDHLVVTEGIEPMAEALVRAIRDPEGHRALARRGRAVVQTLYGWDALADRLERVWRNCAVARADS